MTWDASATGGRVRVDEYMAVETYAHVHHIVSNVTGELREGVSPVEALRAVFPGGTITGCPKVRCMQIIAELEGAPRGPYTGSLGYLEPRWLGRLQHPDPHHVAVWRRTGVPRWRGHRGGFTPGAGARGNARQGARHAAGAEHRLSRPLQLLVDGRALPTRAGRWIAACSMATGCSKP